jgi:hypothetical protein
MPKKNLRGFGGKAPNALLTNPLETEQKSGVCDVVKVVVKR